MDMAARSSEISQELEIVEALRGGDESAFRALLDRYHAAMIRVAATYVESRSAAEEAAREAWLAILVRADRFRGESTLRTWILGILVEHAAKRAGPKTAGASFAFREPIPGRPTMPAPGGADHRPIAIRADSPGRVSERYRRNPRSRARATASARVLTPSLRKTFLVCVLTVFSDR